jgi:dynein heavy chain
MEVLTSKFEVIIKGFSAKCADLLDTNNNKFDRDFVEFNVEISHLDVEL